MSVKDDERRYRMKDLKASSARYGDCEICGMRVSNVHRLMIERQHQPGKWAQEGDAFGHKACLDKIVEAEGWDPKT